MNLVVLNAFMGFTVLRSYVESAEEEKENTEENIIRSLQINDDTSCSNNCISYIDQKIASITPVVQKEVVQRELVVTQAPAQQTIVTTEAKTKSVNYMPIPGAGNTLETSWTVIEGSDFYLSKVDYPGITEVYFEANMKLKNGNGKGYLRVYDVTNSRAVDGSEIETSSQTSEFVSSGMISLWEGYNHYIIQARSLTADTTYFESGRLKIISER